MSERWRPASWPTSSSSMVTSSPTSPFSRTDPGLLAVMQNGIVKAGTLASRQPL